MKRDTKLFTDHLLDVSCSSEEQSVQSLYLLFTEHIHNMMDKYVPTYWSKTRVDLPWLSNSLKRNCRKKQRFYNRAKHSKNPTHCLKY